MRAPAVTARATREAPSRRAMATQTRHTRAMASNGGAAETRAAETAKKRLSRRDAVLGLVAVTTTLAPERARARDASTSTSPTVASESTFSIESRAFRVANLPSYYEEVDLGASAAASAETFLRDSRFGLAANVIQLSSQTASEGGPRALGDIGTAEEVGKRLVEAENAKSRGRAAATLRRVNARTKDGVEYIDVTYEKNVLGVPRVVQTTLALDAKPNGSSTLYTLAVEEDKSRYDADEDAFRAIAEGFTVLSE